MDDEDELLHWLVRRRPGGDAYKMVRLDASGKTTLCASTVQTYLEFANTDDLVGRRRAAHAATDRRERRASEAA